MNLDEVRSSGFSEILRLLLPRCWRFQVSVNCDTTTTLRFAVDVQQGKLLEDRKQKSARIEVEWDVMVVVRSMA